MTNSRVHRLGRILWLLAALCLIATSGSATDLLNYALSDLRVLYLYNDPQRIDWPTIYHLNDEYGARVDLVTIDDAKTFGLSSNGLPDLQLWHVTLSANTRDTSRVDSILARLFADRRPDIVIFADPPSNKLERSLYRRLSENDPKSGTLFNISKVYRRTDRDSTSSTAAGSISIHQNALYQRYQTRIEAEINRLIPKARFVPAKEQLVRYEVVFRRTSGADPNFLSGLERLRLLPVFDSVLSDGPLKESFDKRARNYISLMELARRLVGRDRADNFTNGFKELLALREQARAETSLKQYEDFDAYLSDLVARAERAVLTELGIKYSGVIAVRESPNGPKLKFVSSLEVNGPMEIELSYLRFHPYWDTTAILVDSVSRKVQPHQRFVREYLIDVDREHLESTMPDSLRFSAEIVYARVPMFVNTAAPLRESPDLDIELVPDFFFVPPSAAINVDKVVSAMNWKAVITKPPEMSGTVHVKLETPEGVFAGAYRAEVDLDKGRTAEILRIPFSISNLLELGIHPLTIELQVDGRTVAADTGIMRVAGCQVPDTIAIGYLPDSTGFLEDIFRMTTANNQPLTLRSLLTADLDAYDVILIGSGAVTDYPKLVEVASRLEDYVRHGGSIVVLGQPDQWPADALPIGIRPTIERLTGESLGLTDGAHPLLQKPYEISQSGLTSFFERRQTVASAIVSPGQALYTTTSGGVLLSVSPLGDGQVIYCGIPLVDMIRDLNIDAIHLLANLLNY